MLGLHVGETAAWGTYSNTQANGTANGPPPKPALRQQLTLVGTVVLSNSVVEDDIDANSSDQHHPHPGADPAAGRLLLGLHVRLPAARPRRGVTCRAVEAEIEHVVPATLPYDFYDASLDVAKAQNAIKPEAIALGVFGLVAGLAALLIAGQVIGRQLGFWAHEERTLRAIGADPAMTASDGLLGIMAAVVLGRRWRPRRLRWRSRRWPLSAQCAPTTPIPASPSTGPCSALAC